MSAQAQAVLSGNRLALARLLTQVENDTLQGRDALNDLFPHSGKAHLIGVTGSPGTGKSSLVNRLVHLCRMQGVEKIAVVAVDPTSPFTGGAILGDRVRMRDLATDPGVFIRSMASRGALGGLARATAAVTQVLDAAGFELIFVETVGAGQSEIEIAHLAHTTIVVEAPGLGDEIQAIKAGILEIADILVINKADLPGVENTERAMRMNLDMAKAMHAGENYWQPPVLLTQAHVNEGIDAVWKAIQDHHLFLTQNGQWELRERFRLKGELEMILQNELVSQWRERVPENRYADLLVKVYDRKLSPYEAAKELMDI